MGQCQLAKSGVDVEEVTADAGGLVWCGLLRKQLKIHESLRTITIGPSRFSVGCAET